MSLPSTRTAYWSGWVWRSSFRYARRFLLTVNRIADQTINGNVGIGTVSPTGKLDVKSAATVEGTLIARFTDSTPTPMVEIFDSNDGTAANAANAVIKVKRAFSNSRSINAAGADYAEYIPWSGSKPEPGTVIAYKGAWLVVSSTRTAAFVGNDRYADGEAILVAFQGQLPVTVSGV